MVKKITVRKVNLIAIALIVCSVYLAHQSLQVYSWMKNTQKLIDATTIYEQKGEGPEKWLILGDSLAYGVGASSPENSVAGIIGSRYPDASIDNKSDSGARTADILFQLQDSGKTININQYSDILIIVGGNDIVRSVGSIDTVARDMKQLIEKMAQSNAKVYIVTMPPPHRVSIVHDLVSWAIDRRFYTLDSVITETIASFQNVHYVYVSDIGGDEYSAFEASDRFHLNDRGYQELVNRILEYKNR